MSELTPTQRAWRGRIEAGLRLAAPLLDVLLAAGERISRAVDRDELESGPAPANRTRLAPPEEAGHGG